MLDKKISSNLVIGNALISTKRKQITREQIYKYYEFVDQLLPNNYYTAECSFDSFCCDYAFLVKEIDDTILIDCDNKKLQRYFRIGIPIEIVDVFDKAGIKLNEMEKQANKLNEEQENIAVLRKRIKNILKY